MTDQSTSLGWDVRVAPSEPLLASDLAPGEKARYWSPISATLISGERDAVLVDALLTVGQADDLVEWIAAHDRNLAAVYIPFIGYDLKIAVPFILVFIVLFVRPQGLFGRKSVVRV